MEFLLLAGIVGGVLAWDVKQVKKGVNKFKTRHREITYSGEAAIEYVGIIERSYPQMIGQYAHTTIEIDGQAFTQKTRERDGYNVSAGEHIIKCYEGDKGDNIGIATIKVNIPPKRICKIKYTASQLPMVLPGTIKYKMELMNK